MTTAKWTINTREQQDLHYPAARFNENGCLPVWGGNALTRHNMTLGVLKNAMAVKASIAFFKTSTIDLFPIYLAGIHQVLWDFFLF
jgi:hypothetical protein